MSASEWSFSQWGTALYKSTFLYHSQVIGWKDSCPKYLLCVNWDISPHSFIVNCLSAQGRNFGLKSGVTNSEAERGTFWSRDERRMGRRYAPIRLLGLGERCELSQRGPRWSPGRKRFCCNSISADRLC